MSLMYLAEKLALEVAASPNQATFRERLLRLGLSGEDLYLMQAAVIQPLRELSLVDIVFPGGIAERDAFTKAPARMLRPYREAVGGRGSAASRKRLFALKQPL